MPIVSRIECPSCDSKNHKSKGTGRRVCKECGTTFSLNQTVAEQVKRADDQDLINWLMSFEFVNGVMEAESDGNPFPINFEEVWRAIGYSRRDNAVRALTESSGLELGFDYILDSGDDVRCSLTKEEATDAFRNQWNSTKYRLSGEGFQILSLSSHTEVGNKIRRAYIAIKREYERSQVKTEKVWNEDESAPAVVGDLEYEIDMNNYCEIPDSKSFHIPLEFANRTIRFHSVDYLKSVVIENFTQDLEYVVINGSIFISEATLHLLLSTSRPAKRGFSNSAPRYIITPYDELYRKQVRISANTRFGHR